MRYVRQETVIGKSPQQKLQRLHIVVVGVGALGTVFAEHAVRAGVGTITLIDRDIVELSNLHRQTLFSESDCGKPKATVAKKKLRQINSSITIQAMDDDFENAMKTVEKPLRKNYVLVDCTDNLETRYLLNDLSVKHNVPLIYGSAVGTSGSVALLMGSSPCLRCFLNHKVTSETCESTGVVASITSMVASLQFTLLVQWVQGKKIANILHVLSLDNLVIDKLRIKPDTNCVCCVKKKFEYLDKRTTSHIVTMCGRGMYQITPDRFLKETYRKLKQKKTSRNLGTAIQIHQTITLFPNGRALIKADSLKKAKSLYAKYIGL